MVAYYSEHNVGKTYCLSRLYKYYIEEMGVKYATIACASSNDVINTMINGSAGIMNAYGEHERNRPKHSPMYGTLNHPNGAVTRLVSSESPERSRGISSELLLCDEVGAWSGDALEFFHNLQYGLRLGVSQAIIATTPRKTPVMVELVKSGKDPKSNIRIITGTTMENKALSKQMIENAERTMHTKLGRAEVMGEMVLENDLACWSDDLLDKCRTSPVGEFHPRNWTKAVIGIDPATESTAKSSDETGVILGVLTTSNKVLILKDETARMTGDETIRKVERLYNEIIDICPCKIRTESNGCGAFFNVMLKKHNPFWPIESFASTSKKYARATTCAYLYETGVVFHNQESDLSDLETEQTTWDNSGRSPNHIDALTFVTEGLTNNANFTERKKFIL